MRQIPSLAAAIALMAASVVAAADVPLAIDENPDPNIFETTITAAVTMIDLDGSGTMVEAWTFGGSRPGPEIRVKVGDQVIVHLENQLDFPTSIHWHGVEVNNASDGTSVTQAPVMPGQTFTYRFIAPRAGVFFYHPHMRPMNQVFKGMYGSFIVTDEIEATLTDLGVLPVRDKTLVLSDVTVAQPVGQNPVENYPADPGTPWAGPFEFPGNGFSPTPFELVESVPRDYDGMPSGGDPVPAGTIPFVAPPRECRDVPQVPCRTNEGILVLGNGQVPAPRVGTPDAPGEVNPAPDSMIVPAGRGVRLRLVNTAVQRYFRLRATDGAGNLLPLVRVGGEGGLLDVARLEGGVQGAYETKYDAGEIVLGPSQRADVVLIADTIEGDVITIWERDFERAGFGWSLTPTVPVAHIVVGPSDGGVDTLAAGDPLRTHKAINDPVENLAELAADDVFIDPSTLVNPQPGSTDLTIRLTNQAPGDLPYPSIDGVRGAFEGGEGAPPYQATTRWARIGDLLEITVRNETLSHHPWHHHGFSFQPLRLEDFDGKLLMAFPTEFVDVVDVPGFTQIVYRMRIEDRPQPDGATMGGAIGRWLFHCHLYHHAALGMIGELVVLPECDGDVNADGVIGRADLAMVLGAWNGSMVAADLNFDGVINASDLAILLANWGDCP